MRGKTLAQKNYGEGFRPGPLVQVVSPWPGCAAELDTGHRCQGPVWGSTEIYVDEAPPRADWYTKMLSDLYRVHPRKWVRVRFCEPHAKDVILRTEEYLDAPDMWAPSTASPPMLPRPWIIKKADVTPVQGLIIPGEETA